MLPTLLIVEDERATREGLRSALEEEFEVYTAAGAAEAMTILKSEQIKLLLTDLRLGGESGMDLLDSALALPEPPVAIMMTAYGSVDTAVEAMRRGAWHFVTKPLNIDEVEMLLKRALRNRTLETENKQLVQQVKKSHKLDKLIGKSPAIRKVSDLIQQVAPTRATILIEGESGTGKEVVAHTLHHLSGRPAAKMIIVHCAALSPQLLESELFGHEKGAFTGASQRRIGRFEQADGGTLFLDEIGEIDAATQVKLLRVLSERTLERVGSNAPIKVDVRVVAATNKNLKELVARGDFREDLYFRLNVVKIEMPPLRIRKEDIVLLANSFLQEFAKENDRPVKPLTDEAMQLLLSYSWPGNVRELRTAIEHGVVMSNDSVIEARHLPQFVHFHAIEVADSPPSGKNSLAAPAEFNLHALETNTIRAALSLAGGNRTHAAELLGLSRRTLQRKLKDLGYESSVSIPIFMSINSSQLDTGIIIRRSLFFLTLIILTLGNLFVLFQGLNSPQAMDQAQISREIARGNGFTTKMIRPVAYDQAIKAQSSSVSFAGFQDTYQSPLNPLINAAVFKVIGADKKDSWPLGQKEVVFPLDRVIAVVSTLFFLMAIGVNYLLVSRIFDAKIAGVCAILMLFSQTLWDYSLSGLPQMLMLLLFSCAIYFVYRAVEAAADGRIAMAPAMIAGVFFTLLALTHWMTVWIALGYLIYAAIVFRPRGIVGISLLILLIAAAVPTMLRNQGLTGSPFGTAFLTLYGGLGNGSESAVMRTADLTSQPLVLDGLLSKIVRTALLQATDIIPLLAGIIVAPLFFLSLLHPFKRPSIANFRWAILLMWTTAALGIAFFGISSTGLDANQILLLFAPIMTAYGLAFISILWSRLEIVTTIPMMQNLHHIVIVGICALPLAISLPRKVIIGMDRRDHGGVPHWPPYFAPVLNGQLRAWTADTQIIFSDQPWAVAWYADRISVWLPPTKAGFEKIESIATDLRTPVAGILISPSSHGSGVMSDVINRYKDFASLVIDGPALQATYGMDVLSKYTPQAIATDPQGFSTYGRDIRIQAIAKRYPYRLPLVPMDMIYYSDRQITTRRN